MMCFGDFVRRRTSEIQKYIIEVRNIGTIPNDRGDGGGSAGKQGHSHRRGDFHGDYSDGLWCGVGEKMKKNWRRVTRYQILKSRRRCSEHQSDTSGYEIALKHLSSTTFRAEIL